MTTAVAAAKRLVAMSCMRSAIVGHTAVTVAVATVEVLIPLWFRMPLVVCVINCPSNCFA
jgi:hypothetical protein